MTTLTAGNSASFSIGPYETLTIRTGGRGSLSFTSLAENAHTSFTANVANGNYGPYGVAMQVLMTMTEGSAEYEHSAPDAGNLVTSTTNLTGGLNYRQAVPVQSSVRSSAANGSIRRVFFAYCAPAPAP